MKGVILFLIFLSSLPALAQEPGITHAQNTCTPRERWWFAQNFPQEDSDTFRGLISRRLKPVRGFAEALALRRFGSSDAVKLFGEYWISRALSEGKLPHIARGGYAAIAARAPTRETAGIQLAALGCLVQTYYRYPTLSLPGSVALRLSDLAPFVKTDADRTVLDEAAGIALRQEISDPSPSRSEINRLLGLLKGTGPYESLSRGLWAARNRDHRATIKAMEKFLNDPNVPSTLLRYRDMARITLARAYYTTGQFDPAAAHFKQVLKSSNDLAESLSELAWADLMGEHYPEAIGTGIALGEGGMRHTFAPEGPMVMAMALNEICQYPDAIKAIHTFQRNYQKTYRWLSSWRHEETESEHGPKLYELAVAYLRKSNRVPDRIASEWVRSALFISKQEEINLLFDEKDATFQLSRSGAVEQKKLGLDILRAIRDLKPKLRIAKIKRRPGQALPRGILNALSDLKSQVIHYKRLRLAAPVWRGVLANDQRQAPALEKKLVAEIESDLVRRSKRMLSELDEIAENIQLIEIEIYNGASQDIIWQNAHPDYKEIAEKMKDDSQRASASQVWDWGRSIASDDDNAEIWEDELGSFKANLYDNCASKDKYLALKRLGRH